MPRTSKRRGRRSSLAKVSLDQIRDELSRRENELLGQRADIQRQLQVVDSELAQFNGIAPRVATGIGRRRGRPPGTGAPTARRRGPGRPRGGNGKTLASVL